MTVAVICPALNEEESIGGVVADIARQAVNEIIVVDNGSTDRTAEVAAAAGATVISEPRRGYGAACKAGARAASADVLVYMDADGSFTGDEIGRLVEPIARGQADLVLGSRTLAGADAILPHQRFGNWLTVQLMAAFLHLSVTDLGPFRAIRRQALLSLQLTEMTYGWPVEMMVLAQRAGLRIIEVPVSYGPRLGGESKVSGTLKGSLKAGYCILATLARSLRRKPAASGDGSGHD